MTPFHQTNLATIYCGDALETLSQLPDESVQCCVTSPPYFGLRSYESGPKEIGKEKTPDEFVEALVKVFRETKRILKNDGILWLNLGDSYAASGKGGNPCGSDHVKQRSNRGSEVIVRNKRIARGYGRYGGGNSYGGIDVKPKDLIGIPWMVAFALRAAGWYLRSDIIWAKPNSMPESVTDRPTRSHEYIFLLSKSERYFYDHEAIKEPCSKSSIQRLSQDIENQTGSSRANGGKKTNGNMKAVRGKQRGHSRRHDGFNGRWDEMERTDQCSGMRNKRDVWTIAPAVYSEAHFATFPPDLIRPCILAGSRVGDVVIDPFCGSGTTGQVSLETGRKFIGIELNPTYCNLIVNRMNVTPGLPL